VADPSPVSAYLAFAQDPDVRVRAKALRILADNPDRENLGLLIRAMADPASEVRRAAAECLRHALPWLGVWPMHQDRVPDSCQDHRFGEGWHQLHLALEDTVDSIPAPNAEDPVWCRVPLLATLMEAERACQGTRPTAPADSYLDRRLLVARTNPQVILVPTYDCNITCSYCYAKSWAGRHGRQMSGDDRRTALDWCARQGIKTLVLGGGEPTVYRDMPAFVVECRDRGLTPLLTSNGLFGPRIRDLLTPENFRELVAHYDQESLDSDRTRRERFRDNLLHARAGGLTARLRFTLTDRTDAAVWKRALDLAAECGVKTVNFALAFENSNSDNRFLDLSGSLQPGGWMEHLLRDFVTASIERGVPPHLSKPFPLCGVSDETLRLLGETEALRTACAITWQGYTQNLTINPDLTTFPCNAIGVAGPRVTDFPTLADASRHYRRLMEPIVNRPSFAACARCPLHYLGACKPSCNAREVALLLAQQCN
jgi:organic radical activating enzyme